MKNYNMVSKPMQVSSERIFADYTYQRPVNEKRVAKIVASFDPALVNPIKVSNRDGKLWVFDGQHTLAALKKRNGGKELMVFCLVYEGLTQKDEAYLFSQQNGIAQAVAVDRKLNALHVAEDPKVTDMVNIIHTVGFDFDFSNHKQGERKLLAGAALWRMYQKSTRQEFIDSLEIVRDAWHFEAESLKSEILGGVNCFYTYPPYRGRVDKKLAAKKLRVVEPRIIIRKGKAFERGGDKRFAKYMAEIYNKGLRTNRLPGEVDVYS